MKTKNGVINVRIPDRVRDALRDRGVAEGISMSEYVRRLLEQKVAEKPAPSPRHDPRPIVDAAVRYLYEGRRILYVTTRPDRMRAILQLVAAALPSDIVHRVNYGAADQRVQTTNGGVLALRASSQSGGRGFTADVLLLDDVSDRIADDALPCLFGSDVAEVIRW